ncbi:MAG: ankyrin repeat domain-containing protein, partial [Planctomycetales bacterium]
KVDSRSEDGFTALHIATHVGNVELMKFLLAEGAEVNARTEDGTTPLMTAAMEGKLAAASFLLANKADPNLKDDLDQTALSLAIEKKFPQVADLLRSRP